MRDFTITSDSTVDIGPERMRELNVPYVSLKCIHKDGEFSDDMTEATAKEYTVSCETATNQHIPGTGR